MPEQVLIEGLLWHTLGLHSTFVTRIHWEISQLDLMRQLYSDIYGFDESILGFFSFRNVRTCLIEISHHVNGFIVGLGEILLFVVQAQ